MNLLSLPTDLKNHIYFFIKTHHANIITRSWRRYFSYKKFIISSIYYLPKILSFIDHDFIFPVYLKNTFFFFKKLFYITTGRESFFYDIYLLFYRLAVSIDDYEWIHDHYNYFYSYNKFYSISIATKFKWHNILKLLL